MGGRGWFSCERAGRRVGELTSTSPVNMVAGGNRGMERGRKASKHEYLDFADDRRTSELSLRRILVGLSCRGNCRGRDSRGTAVQRQENE